MIPTTADGFMDLMGPGSKANVKKIYADTRLANENAAATAAQTELAKKQFGLANRQFEANQSLRDQLLAYLGISGSQPNQPGGPSAGPNSGLFRELIGRQDANRAEYVGLLDGFGESYRADINDRYDTSLKNALGNLESRGLGSSSLAGVAMSANQRDRGRELLSLEDQLVGKRLDTLRGADESIASSYRNQLNDSAGLINALIGAIR